MDKELNRAQKLRARTGLSQSKFAKKFGIPVRTVQAWEINFSSPPVYVFDLIERVLDFESKLEGDTNEKES